MSDGSCCTGTCGLPRPCCCRGVRADSEQIPSLQKETLAVLRSPYAAGWESIVAAVADSAFVLGELERRGIIQTKR